MGADPFCHAVGYNRVNDSVIVNEDKLANVVVYVRGESLNDYSFDTPSKAVRLEHMGCGYVPHVLGLQIKQTLRVVNNDGTTTTRT